MAPLRRVRIRTLAIDPSPKGFGFVVFEGPERLLDWGVAQVWSKTSDALLARIETFLCRYTPALLVLEDMDNTQRRGRAARRIAEVARYAVSRRVPVRLVSRQAVRALFAATGATKYEIAVAIADSYPELAPRLPRRRKPWMSEDERMNIFDAAALALTALCAVDRHGPPLRKAA